MSQNKTTEQAITPEVLDRTMIRMAMNNAMKTPLSRTASAAIFAVPPGWETDVLKARGAMEQASSSDELQQLVQQGQKTIFVPKESALHPGVIAKQLEALYADVAIFMEVTVAA
ncbi:MAG: hypothetical protein K2Q01_12455 [Rickettsiales bacterium]|nr:hypothetical protein [Rickettsiales bacterium]